MPEPGLKSQFSFFPFSTFSPQPLSHCGSHSSHPQNGGNRTSLPTRQVFLGALHREHMKQVKLNRATAGPEPLGCNPQALKLRPPQELGELSPHAACCLSA